MTDDPNTLMKAIGGLAGPLLGAALGRAMEVAGHGRLTVARALFVEIPTAAGMAVLTWGLADHFDLSVGEAAGAGVVFGYLGTRGIDLATGLLRLRTQGRSG